MADLDGNPKRGFLNLNLNSLLVTRQMTLFHQGARMGGENAAVAYNYFLDDSNNLISIIPH